MARRSRARLARTSWITPIAVLTTRTTPKSPSWTGPTKATTTSRAAEDGVEAREDVGRQDLSDAAADARGRPVDEPGVDPAATSAPERPTVAVSTSFRSASSRSDHGRRGWLGLGQREVALLLLGGVQAQDGVQPVEQAAQLGHVGVVGRARGRCRRAGGRAAGPGGRSRRGPGSWGRADRRRRAPWPAPGRGPRPRPARGAGPRRPGPGGHAAPGRWLRSAGSTPSASAAWRSCSRSARMARCSALKRWARSAPSSSSRTRAALGQQDAQRVEDHGDVDGLLEQRAPHRRQVAEARRRPWPPTTAPCRRRRSAGRSAATRRAIVDGLARGGRGDRRSAPRRPPRTTPWHPGPRWPRRRRPGPGRARR